MSQIIKLMKAMGYSDVSEGGVCFGLAQTAILAHTLGNRKNWVELHKTLAKLEDHEIKVLVGMIEKSGETNENFTKTLEEEELESKLENVGIDNVRVFLESVYLYQQGHDREPELLSKPPAIKHRQNDLYYDVLLEEEKEKIARLYVQNQDEFIELLESIKIIDGRVGFEIGITGHAFGLIFDGSNWILIDHDTVLENTDTEVIAKRIFRRAGNRVLCSKNVDERLLIHTLTAYAGPGKYQEIQQCEFEMDKFTSFDRNSVFEFIDSANIIT